MIHQTAVSALSDSVCIFTQAWLPDSSPRAGLLLAHGLAEHSGRYAHVGAHLAEHGYALFAFDLRGHGQSTGERVSVASFDEYTADMLALYQQVRATYPDLPLFAYGHSMGSLVALLFALEKQADLAGIVVTGNALRPASFKPVLIPIVRVLNKIVPHAYVLPRLENEAISRDPAIVEQYRSDPLVYIGQLPIQLGAAALHATLEVETRLPEVRLPVLAMHGSEDRLTRLAGLDIMRAGIPEPYLTVKVYQGLAHEVHNEPEQATVLDDLAAWLDQHTQ